MRENLEIRSINIKEIEERISYYNSKLENVNFKLNNYTNISDTILSFYNAKLYYTDELSYLINTKDKYITYLINFTY